MQYEKVKSIEIIEFEDSYDFEVEYVENFFCNNILVHNCRGIVTKEGCFSRNKEEFVSVPHISEALKPLFEIYPDLVLDGELYNHDYKDDFNSIISLIKKKKPTQIDLEDSKQKIQYWIYDFPSIAKSFQDRWRNGSGIVKTEIVEKIIVLTPTAKININEVDLFAADYLQDGFEGAMVRLNEPYEFKRSTSLMKWKEFQDEEFLIVDVVDGDGNRSGIAASVICSLPDGRTFGSGPLGTHEYCKWMFENKDDFIGKYGTVVFQNYTPDGIPRFPKFKGIRPDFDL